MRGDVRDAEAVRAARGAGTARRCVFHLAAQAIVRTSLARPRRHVRDERARDGARARRGAATRRSCASRATSATRPGGRPHRESDPLGGRDPYSRVEGRAGAGRRRPIASRSACRVATARAGNVIGGGDWARGPAAAGPRPGARVRRAGGAAQPRRRAPVAARARGLSPATCCSPSASPARREFATAWNFGPAGSDARPVRWIVDRVRERWPLEVRTEPGSRRRRGAGAAARRDGRPRAPRLDAGARPRLRARRHARVARAGARRRRRAHRHAGADRGR